MKKKKRKRKNHFPHPLTTSASRCKVPHTVFAYAPADSSCYVKKLLILNNVRFITKEPCRKF